MGWFWAETPVTRPTVVEIPSAKKSPPSGCPMHKKTVDAFKQGQTTDAPPPSSCPIPHDKRPSLLSQLNPLNYMFRDLSQDPAANQTYRLPTSREESSIPKGAGEARWEYPSPQQMYNALLRKGYDDTDVTAVEQMVAVHNFLNEGAWEEVIGWERRFGGGLWRGFQVCKRGEEHVPEQLRGLGSEPQPEPTLVRFQGRPKDMTPKAALWQLLGKVHPDRFGVEPPFDRHDWYVSRQVNGQTKEVRYVIDYYSGPPEPTGEPVFFLDVRPAMTPTGAAERIIRWGTDMWWRASGGDVREAGKSATDSS